jgi:hypothetical protein
LACPLTHQLGTHSPLRHAGSLQFDFSTAETMQPEKFHAGTWRSLRNGGRYPTFFSLPRREAAATEAALVLKGSRMPALFAYLLAIGLLLGGGYGALTWLAAPEPVKIAAKAITRKILKHRQRL